MTYHVEESAAKTLWEAARTQRNTRICLLPRELDLTELCNSTGNDEWKHPELLKAAERVIGAICSSYATGEVTNGRWVSISSRELRALCGRIGSGRNRRWLYIPVLAMLTELGVIEINHRYSTGVPGGTDAFSKSFRLGPSYRRRFQYKEVVQVAGRSKEQRRDHSRPMNSLHSALLTNASRLQVDWERLEEVARDTSIPLQRQGRIIEDAKKIDHGLVNLSEGATQKRVYHSINCAAREIRRALRVNGEKLTEVDVRSCQPVLLLTLCPEEERESYKEVLHSDVYSLSKASRDVAKRQFGRFAFGSYKRKNSFGEEFTRRFPVLAHRMRNFEGSLCAYLQNLEAELCLYGVGAKLQERGIFWVNIHDAFLVLPRDVALVAQLIRDEFARRIPDFLVEVRCPHFKFIHEPVTTG